MMSSICSEDTSVEGRTLVQLIIGDIAARLADLDKLLDAASERSNSGLSGFWGLSVWLFTFCSRCHPLLKMVALSDAATISQAVRSRSHTHPAVGEVFRGRSRSVKFCVDR